MVVSLCLLLITLLAPVYCTKSCTLDIEEYKEYLPVFIQDGQIMYPDEPSIELDENEEMTLACPGKGNRFSIKSLGQELKVTCVDGQLQGGNENAYTLKELKCLKDQPTANIVSTKETCANGGLLKKIVFEFGSTSMVIYKTCYKIEKLQSLYSVHTIGGRYWQPVHRTSFLEDGAATLRSTHISKLYTQKQQNTTVTKISTTLNKFWQRDFLARGHLSAAGDFNFCSTQTASFFYINVAPQWQKFNSGNWVKVEYNVRNLVKSLQEPLTVYTGTHDILELPDSDNNEHEIYLSGEKLPVPKYFWKVVYNPRTREGMAFLGMNNVYTNSTTEMSELCSDICDKIGASSKSFKNGSKGLVRCCDVDELRQSVPNMEDVPSIKRLLKFNQ